MMMPPYLYIHHLKIMKFSFKDFILCLQVAVIISLFQIDLIYSLHPFDQLQIKIEATKTQWAITSVAHLSHKSYLGTIFRYLSSLSYLQELILKTTFFRQLSYLTLFGHEFQGVTEYSKTRSFSSWAITNKFVA